MSKKPFVLVHGAWHGGWCWARVAPLLAAAGHRILTPTCTGLGDRAHLLSPAVGLDTFIDDVAAAIATEELTDIVLVGHSFAGSVISGVADRMPERIAQLIYLDATVLRSGQSPFDMIPPDVVAARRRAAAESSGGLTLPVPPASAFGVDDPADAAWLARHLRPHPLKTYEDPLRLQNPLGNGRPKTYIACTQPEYAVLAPVRAWVQAQPDWAFGQIATGHDAMVTAPELLARTLLRFG
ncbi:MAG: alpha/beta fold hydrolase [Alphaproteobacteria bacterium]|nr:alpha/beta fold hydrolase [Alphaproteobacteria bacterium]